MRTHINDGRLVRADISHGSSRCRFSGRDAALQAWQQHLAQLDLHIKKFFVRDVRDP